MGEHVFVSDTRAAVEQLVAEGLRPSEIARELGLASQTVSYHVGRINRGEVDRRRRPERQVKIDDSVRRRPTRETVQELLGQGVKRADVARSLGLSKATVSYHARRLGLAIDERCARRYDWVAIQRHHDEGHSRRDCLKRFGMSPATWYEAVNRGELTPRPAHTPLAELLVAGTYRSRHNIKLRLLGAGVKAPHCECCGIESWRGRPLSLSLHHVNGDRLDNRLENLRLLCPNCHSQTENFAGRNGRRGRGGGAASRAIPSGSGLLRPRRGPWAVGRPWPAASLAGV